MVNSDATPSLKGETVVVGGTPFDSGKGAKYLALNGIEAEAIGISSIPDEQSALYAEPKKLQRVFDEKVGSKHFSNIVIYCNSLCFAGNWETLYPGRIFELVKYYRQILSQAVLDKLAIIVAEETTAKNLKSTVEDLKICPADNLNIFPDIDLIKSLEAASEKQQIQLIYDRLQILIEQGYTEVLFGCTHLDDPQFSNIPGLKVYQPGLDMLNDFIQFASGSKK